MMVFVQVWRHDRFLKRNVIVFNANLAKYHCDSVQSFFKQLHGTGLAYKKLVGNCQRDLLKTEFPGLEEQIQVKDLLDTPEKRSNLR